MEGQNCIFCKIVDDNTSAKIISQDDNAIAFLDAFPLAEGHTLIIPTKHYSKIQDMSREHSSAIFDMLRTVTAPIEEASEVNASTIAIHNGIEAGQEILHVHIHIIPRISGDGAGPVHSMFKTRPKISSEKMDSILNRIKKRLELS